MSSEVQVLHTRLLSLLVDSDQVTYTVGMLLINYA